MNTDTIDTPTALHILRAELLDWTIYARNEEESAPIFCVTLFLSRRLTLTEIRLLEHHPSYAVVGDNQIIVTNTTVDVITHTAADHAATLNHVERSARRIEAEAELQGEIDERHKRAGQRTLTADEIGEIAGQIAAIQFPKGGSHAS